MSKAKELLEKLDLWEMANLSPKRTGVNACIYISGKQGDHGPRVKLGLKPNFIYTGECVSISVEESPEIKAGDPKVLGPNSKKLIEDTILWIKKNRENLIKLWNGELYFDEFVELSQKI